MTISIEVLKRVSVVYTHKNCPDGMASAMILKDAFRMLGTSPRVEFLAHGTPEHRDAIVRHYSHSQNAPALFCDIAPHPDVYRDHVVAGAIVLDHHKGVEELVSSFGELGVFADEKLEPGVSGAVLAWREVWEPLNRETGEHDFLLGIVPEQVKIFAGCVGARDTWQTDDPRFRRGQWISKMLMSKPADFWLDGPGSAPRNHPPYLTEEEVQIGRALFEAHEEAVRQAVDQCLQLYVERPGGELVGLYVFQEQASGFRLCSDVAEALRTPLPTPHIPGERRVCHVVAGFSYVVDKPGGEPRLLYSLRGLNGFDAAAFAKANGGGGHTAAAGFSVPNAQPGGGPYEFIRACLARHLAGKP